MSDSVDTTVDTTSSRERIKRALSHGKKGRINKDLSNKIMLGVFRAAAYITTLVLLAIIAYVVINGLPHISLDFIFGWPQGVNAEGGIWPTIVSTIYVTALAMLICTPVAVLAAVYLAEYAKQGKVVDIIRYAADALASVPSIVMGLFGYALFVEAMGLGLSMVSAALALALLMLPIVMRTTEEAIRAVPRYIRWGAYGLGATKWQVVSKIVLPSAFGRIATGIVLAIGRAIGETAALHHGSGHQSADLAARFRSSHDRPPLFACQRRHQHERSLRHCAFADGDYSGLQPVCALSVAQAPLVKESHVRLSVRSHAGASGHHGQGFQLLVR